jgi:hypothetical protein
LRPARIWNRREKKLSRLIFFGAFTIWRQKSQVSVTATLPFPATTRKSSMLGNHLSAWIWSSSFFAVQLAGLGKLPTRLSSCVAAAVGLFGDGCGGAFAPIGPGFSLGP